jgi:hypothetical protein
VEPVRHAYNLPTIERDVGILGGILICHYQVEETNMFV